MNYVYLDNAATTKIDPRVAEVVAHAGEMDFYNSAALYGPSLLVKQKIQAARGVILKRLCKSGDGELVFTSGATESNNIVIFSKAVKHGRVLLLEGEHSSAHMPIKHLKDNGYTVEMIPLMNNGLANPHAIGGAGDGAPTLVVFGLVNSDTGTIQDAQSFVREIRARYKNAHIHCDATQGFCKIPFDAMELDLDSVAISAHKIGGPKGIGALWVKKGVHLKPQMHGGGQQILRPGTENTPGILGFAKSVEIYETQKNLVHVGKLHTHLIKHLPNGCTINGLNNNPYITNIQLSNVLGQTVMNALGNDGILVGLGSACSSNSSINRTLVAMGINEQKTRQVLRISFSPTNTIKDVDAFTSALKKNACQN